VNFRSGLRPLLGACAPEKSGHSSGMPLIKLNRINKGGDIVLNSEHIVFIEMEARSTTVHMTHNLLFSVEETPVAIAERVEHLESARIKHAILESGLGKLPG
jgi:hypothetical protein